jgi:hypothetical protein
MPATMTIERYIVIDGRRWRRSDPSIPEPFRVELVRALMSARRAVGAALRAHDVNAESEARACVQDAKLALGERGRAPWEAPTPTSMQRRAAAAIRALLRSRGPGKTICPSDVARVIGAAGWRSQMSLVREVAADLVAREELRVLQRGQVVDPRSARGPIRLAFSRTSAMTPPRSRRSTRRTQRLPEH